MGQQQSLAVIEENDEVCIAKHVQPSEDLRELQNRAIKEYPYLANVYESIVVTDPHLPDNPIIYCNDFFQRMTLYPREEIIGKNCRFLQGKYTSQTTKRKIREAIDAGKEMDVQLLNYRKDGTPFWNNFLLLPIHKNKHSKKVTHLVGIQKDVTYLKQGTKNPSNWGPKEVALYATYAINAIEVEPGSINVADVILAQGINGSRFVSAKKSDWLKWGVSSKPIIKALLASSKKLQKEEDKYDAFKLLLNKGLKDESDEDAEDARLANLFSMSSTIFSRPHKVVDIGRPRQLSFWNQKPSLGVTCIKFFYEDDVDVHNYAQDVKYEQLLSRVKELYPHVEEPFRLIAKTREGDSPISNDEEFQKIKTAYIGRTLSIQITRF